MRVTDTCFSMTIDLYEFLKGYAKKRSQFSLRARLEESRKEKRKSTPFSKSVYCGHRI